MANKTATATATTTATTTKVPNTAPVTAPKQTGSGKGPEPSEKPLRPSDVPKMIDGQKVDGARWLRENGRPNPTRLIRVTGRKGGENLEPAEVEVVDETAAIGEFIKLRKIKEPHRVTFKAFILEE